MSLLNRVSRLTPWEIGRTVSAVPQPRRSIGDNQNTVTRQLRQITRQLEELQRSIARQQKVLDTFYSSVIEQALIPGILERFGPALDGFVRHDWPAFGSLSEAGIDLGVTNSRLLFRLAGYEIKPHRDPRWALLTCLVYLQKHGEVQTCGTQFYRLKAERDSPHSSPSWAEYAECELVRDVPARRNTAVIFLNSTGAHGATVPADAPKAFKRFVYQAQFGPDSTTKERLVASLPGDRRPMWSTARDASRY